ncbi:MAG: MFS transporter [Pseudomonadota bacterium]|jgi:ACS family hexuronate transporter-like MFS transporter|uniref:Hexuronate transporter n=1 Tax=hydrothermal vent metagenome TaxID=652676 RepID=A0A170PPQ0_9ZZZZ
MRLGRMMKIRWWIIGLVMIGTILNYLTRSIMGVAAPTAMAELHISTEQYSWITGGFQLGIMLQPVAGYILDMIGLKTGLALFAAAWGIITMAHALATGWISLAGLRALLGFAEGTAHPGALKVISEWFPARERGFAGGVYNIGASLGSVLAPLLVAGAVMVWDWRGAFIVAGIFALIWAASWRRFYHSPENHPTVPPGERAEILEGQESYLRADTVKPPLGRLLRQRNLWGIALPRFLADPTWGTLTLWMPLYLTTVRHFDLGQIAMFAGLPFIAADLGCLFGPAVVLWLQRRGISLINARRGAYTLGAVLMTGMMFVGQVESAAAAVALLCLGGFAHQTLSVTCITMASDLFPRNEVGTAAGIAGTMANLGVLLFSLAMGHFVETIGYGPFFIALGVLDLFAAATLWILVRAPEPQKEPTTA